MKIKEDANEDEVDNKDELASSIKNSFQETIIDEV